MSPVADSVIRRLDAARQKWWFFSLLTTTVLAASASFGMFLCFMLADSLLRFSQWILLGLFLVWLLATVVILCGVGRRLLGGQRSLEAAARRVEAEFPDLGSNLMNVVQLSEDSKNADRAFCEAAVEQAAAEVEHVPFDQAPRRNRTGGDSSIACTRRATWPNRAAFCCAAGDRHRRRDLIPNWSSAASRLLAPGRSSLRSDRSRS